MMWIHAFGMYFLMGTLIYGMGMLSPRFKKNHEDCRKRKRLYALYIGMFAGWVFWPLVIPFFVFMAKRKTSWICPTCSFKSGFDRCPVCGERRKIDMSLFMKEGIKKKYAHDPLKMESMIRIHLLVQKDPAIVALQNKLISRHLTEPERKTLGEEYIKKTTDKFTEELLKSKDPQVRKAYEHAFGQNSSNEENSQPQK